MSRSSYNCENDHSKNHTYFDFDCVFCELDRRIAMQLPTKRNITLDDVARAWNDAADQYNTWDTLDADERVEFVIKLFNNSSMSRNE
jgi:hypothetical protein